MTEVPELTKEDCEVLADKVMNPEYRLRPILRFCFLLMREAYNLGVDRALIANDLLPETHERR